MWRRISRMLSFLRWRANISRKCIGRGMRKSSLREPIHTCLPAPIQMSDALSRNSPKVEGVEPLQANCLAHGRRQVVEVADHFPEECRYVLETLRDVYHHDALAREQPMSPEQRLRFHQDHSEPLMKG